MRSLLLIGCGSGKSASERVGEKRAELEARGSLAFTAGLTADLGDEEFECTLRCASTPEGVEVSVLKPENLAEVEALVSPDGETVTFSGLGLVLPLGENGVSPFAAAAHILDALKSAHLTDAYELAAGDREYIAAETYLGENGHVTVWYALPDLEPEYAEIVSDGRAVIKCSISDLSQ